MGVTTKMIGISVVVSIIVVLIAGYLTWERVPPKAKTVFNCYKNLK